jgi:hypothetical protein
MIPAALLNFVAGLAAGAGINLLTSIEGGSTAQHHEIVIDSIMWLASAMCLAYAAHLTEGVEGEAALVIDSTLTQDEKRVVLKDEAFRIRWRYRLTMTSSAITTIAASVLTPGLLHY